MTTLDDVENGVSQIQSIACQIRALGGHTDAVTIESAILRALPKSFAAFLTSWTFLDAEKRCLENLHAHLMRQVAMLRTAEVQVKEKALSATEQGGKFKAKTTGDKRASGDKSDLFCRYCKKKNHGIKDCRKLANKRKRDAEAGASNSTNVENNDQSNVRPPPAKESNPDPQDKNNAQSGARVAYGLAATSNAVPVRLKTSTSSKFVNSVWTIDSGASFLMTFNLEWIADYREFNNRIPIKHGDGHIFEAYGKSKLTSDYLILSFTCHI